MVSKIFIKDSDQGMTIPQKVWAYISGISHTLLSTKLDLSQIAALLTSMLWVPENWPITGKFEVDDVGVEVDQVEIDDIETWKEPKSYGFC